MQPQQPGVVQPMYIAQPVTRAPVVETYAHRQSTVIGALLIVTGALSIIVNIVDLVIGTKYSTWLYTFGLSIVSLGFIGHGLWCGAMVGISVTSESLIRFRISETEDTESRLCYLLYYYLREPGYVFTFVGPCVRFLAVCCKRRLTRALFIFDLV